MPARERKGYKGGVGTFSYYLIASMGLGSGLDVTEGVFCMPTKK